MSRWTLAEPFHTIGLLAMLIHSFILSLHAWNYFSQYILPAEKKCTFTLNQRLIVFCFVSECESVIASGTRAVISQYWFIGVSAVLINTDTHTHTHTAFACQFYSYPNGNDIRSLDTDFNYSKYNWQTKENDRIMNWRIVFTCVNVVALLRQNFIFHPKFSRYLFNGTSRALVHVGLVLVIID